MENKFKFKFNKKTYKDNIVSVIAGTVLLLSSIYLYNQGFQSNWIVAMGILGVIKLS
jgi:hypothetical protein